MCAVPADLILRVCTELARILTLLGMVGDAQKRKRVRLLMVAALLRAEAKSLHVWSLFAVSR
jgi:hypothetical protein